jgi:hypothetical protein
MVFLPSAGTCNAGDNGQKIQTVNMHYAAKKGRYYEGYVEAWH